MTDRKTVQALKLSASWTPTQPPDQTLARQAFAVPAPLRFEGGRHRMVAAFRIDTRDPQSVLRASTLAQEIRDELAGTGTLHSFITEVGRAPTDSVTDLPMKGETA